VLTGVLAIVASGLVPDAPSTATARDEEITEYWAAHMSALQWSVALWSLAAVGLLVFAAYAPTLLEGSHHHPALRRLTTAAGACAASVMLASQATLAVAVREDFTAADATVRRTVFILTDVLYNALDLMLPAIGVLIGSLAILALNRLILPRWLGVFGLLVATFAILGALAPIHGEAIGPFEILEVAGYLLWPLWMIAAGITLAVRTPDTSTVSIEVTLPA
jgi:hypothetical protein